jgi:ADP-ribose pyrophosphatase
MPEPLSDDPVSVEVLSSETVYRGNVWNIEKERFLLDGGQITREYMAHTGAVAILALDERDRMLVIKQYRHPIRMREWELPAGLLDVAGESPLLAAQRELAEETDLVAESWGLLCEFTTTAGGSNEVIRVFLARGVSAAPSVHERTEEEAGIELRWVPIEEVVEAVLDRRVQNAILAIATMTAQVGRDRGWSTLAPADAPWPRHPLNRSGN